MTQPAHERLMTRLTALELSIQGGIHSLRSDSLSERDASALSAQLVNQLAQHRTLVEDAGRALAALQTAPVLGGSDGGSTSGGGANPPLAAAFGSDRGERERRTALDAHRQIGGELAAQVRRAQVQCATGARSDRRNRQLLGLDRASDDERGRNSSASQAVHIKELEELASLERAHASLQDEVKRSEAALQAFARSSSTLRETNDEFRGQSDTMTTSRRLANKLRQRDRTDRWLLLVGVVFVSLVALSIVKSRLVAPVWSYVSSTSSAPQSGGAFVDSAARTPPPIAGTANANHVPRVKSIPHSTMSAQVPVPPPPPPPAEHPPSPTPEVPSHDRSRRDHAASANGDEPPRRQAESDPHGQPTQPPPSRQHPTAGSHRTARKQRVHDEL